MCIIFMSLIFVGAIDYENILTTKISRFTVHVHACMHACICLSIYNVQCMYISSNSVVPITLYGKLQGIKLAIHKFIIYKRA